jgi:hypothetical protein
VIGPDTNGGGNGKGEPGAVQAPASAPKRARARGNAASLDETLKILTRIAARREMAAMAELEADELAGPKRRDVLETIAKVPQRDERHRQEAPAASRSWPELGVLSFLSSPRAGNAVFIQPRGSQLHRSHVVDPIG